MSEESYVMVFGEVFSYTQIIKNEKIVERLKEELRSWEYYEGQLYDSITAPNLVILLQKLLGIKGWTPKHTEIAKESEEMFRTHKGEEVDI